MKVTAHKDEFLENVWYFKYDPIETDAATIDFGDGTVTPVFKPKGQIAHQYDDNAPTHTVTITDGENVETVKVPPEDETARPKPKPRRAKGSNDTE